MLLLIVALSIFVLGYVGMTLEHTLHINKAAFALLSGTLLWVLVGFASPELVQGHIIETGFDIFSITIFLLASMALVEVLVHYRLFDVLRDWLSNRRVSTRGQFFLFSGIAFLVSTMIANMTAAIVLIQIARKFFWGKNMLLIAIAIVIATNAGGTFSPIGDVTTLMLWVAGKFSASEIILFAVLPSLTVWSLATWLLARKVENEPTVETQQVPIERLTRGERIVIITVALSFILPVFATFVDIPPVVGILFGVGLTWFVVDLIKGVSKCRTHLTASIESLIQKTDIASIKFFVGILLAVSALGALGVLEYISHFVYGAAQTVPAIITGNIILGFLSAVLDNIPLTAIAVDILETTDTNLWVLLAITVGIGGSLLPIGSASGVVAMGLVKELTFKEYVKLGFVPMLVAFIGGIAVWGMQTMFL